jgi:hypothetical protein
MMYDGMDRIKLAQERVQWWAVVFHKGGEYLE